MKDALDAFQKILLLNPKELPSLGSGPRSNCEPLKPLQAKLSSIFSQTQLSENRQMLVRSLVLLWHDYLDESHSISQNIHNEDGSFLHGIMHRREPDYGNAKYWFHRVREHLCFPIIAERSGKILDAANAAHLKSKLIHADGWDAFAFVDACENAVSKNDEPIIFVLKQIQEIEFKTLLEHFLR